MQKILRIVSKWQNSIFFGLEFVQFQIRRFFFFFGGKTRIKSRPRGPAILLRFYAAWVSAGGSIFEPQYTVNG